LVISIAFLMEVSMARARKTPAKPKVEPPEQAGTVKIIQNERREYTAPQLGAATVAAEPPEIEEEEYRDPIQVFLDELDDEREGLVLRVEKLPSFQVDGKSGVRATRVFMGDFPFDEAIACNYLGVVQSLYGGGRYQFEIRRGGLSVQKRWTAEISAPRAQPVSGQVTRIEQGQPNQVQTSAPVDQVKALQEQFKLVGELLRLAKEVVPQQPPAAAAAQANPPDPAAQVEMAALTGKMSIIEGLIKSGNNPLAERLLEKFFGDGDAGGGSWAEVVKGVFEYIGPAIAPFAQVVGQMLMARMTGVAGGLAGAPAVSAAARGLGPALPSGPAINVQPEPPAGMSPAQHAVNGFFDKLIHDCTQGRTQTEVVDMLLDLGDTLVDPNAIAILSNVAYGEPAAICAQFPPLNTDIGKLWLAEMQRQFKEAMEPRGEEVTDAPLTN
jgi:hypothetical protein